MVVQRELNCAAGVLCFGEFYLPDVASYLPGVVVREAVKEMYPHDAMKKGGVERGVARVTGRGGDGFTPHTLTGNAGDRHGQREHLKDRYYSGT